MAQILSRTRDAFIILPRPRWSVRRAIYLLGLVGLLTWVAFSLADGTRLLMAAQELWSRPELLVFFLMTYTGAFYLRALAWRLLLPHGPGVPGLFRILQIALLANHLFPTKVGDVLRVGLLARRGIPIGSAAGATGLARLLDFGTLCLIVVILGPLAGARLDHLAFGLTLPLAGVAGGALACYLLRSGRLAPLWSRLPGRLAKIGWEVQAALAVTSVGRLVSALALIVPSWLLEAGALWAMAQAMGVPLSPVVAAAATAFAIAFQAFQVTPGGLGLYEATLTGALALAGLDPSTGLALALATHALKFAYAYLVGFPCLLAEGLDGLGERRWTVDRGRWTVDGGPWAGQVARLRSAVHQIHCPLPVPVVGISIAGLAYLVVHVTDWSAASFWPAFAGGLLATAPLVVLGRCHHLPARLIPLLLLVPLVFSLWWGLPAAGAGLIAVAASGVLAVWRGPVQPLAVLWPGFLTQSLAVGGERPLEAGLFGLAALLLILLIRQWWLGHHSLPPPGPPAPGSRLAVLIPVHNEAATIAAIVAGVPRSVLRELGRETLVVVIDDGSTDGSGALAGSAGADLVVRHPTRRGLGAALRTGLATARRTGAGAVVYLDGDGEYDPQEIPAVAGPVIRGEADYVLGSRFPQAGRLMRPSRRFGNAVFTALLCLLTGRRLRDGQTGFRAFSARALATAEIVHDYNYAQILTLDLLRKRLRLAHVPISYRVRRQGRSFIRYREYLRRVLPAIAREVLLP